MTIDRSKAVKGGIQYGVCGEQGGEPNSVAFFHSVSGKAPALIPTLHQLTCPMRLCVSLTHPNPKYTYEPTLSLILFDIYITHPPTGGPELRLVLPVPRAHRVDRRRAGRHQGGEQEEELNFS